MAVHTVTTNDDTYYGTAFGAGPNDTATDLSYGGWGDFYYDYFKFDNLPAISGNEVLAAKLRIYSTGSVNNPVAHIRRITSSWSGSTLTRTNTPTEDSANWGNMPNPAGGGWIETNITNLVRGWLNGTFSNFGLKVHPTSNNQANGAFRSKEHSTGEFAAYIEIITGKKKGGLGLLGVGT